MFGLFRTILAIWVVLFHLVDIPKIGSYAVFSFFMLSGFLMTTILHDSYSYSHEGRKRYALNRLLRLFPMYWVVTLFTVVVIILVSEEYAIIYKDVIYLPKSLKEYLMNIFMIFPSYFPWDSDPRLSPPVWALTIELFFYICIGLGLSRTKKITQAWLLFSLVYYASSYVFGLNPSHRYGSVLGASLPFSIGAWAYFYKKHIYQALQKIWFMKSVITMLIIYSVNAFVFSLLAHIEPSFIPKGFLEIGKYINLMLSLLTIILLYYDGKLIFNTKLDKVIGDFSYPIYLCHWQCGLLATYLLFDKPTKGFSFEGGMSFLLAMIFVILFSIFLIFFIDKNVSNIRNKIKNSMKFCNTPW